MDPNSTRMFCILRGNAVAVAGGQQQRSVCCGHNSCCSSPHHQHSRPVAQVTTSCCKTAKAKRGGNQERESWAIIIVKNETNDDAGEFLPSLERPPRHVLLICRETLSQVRASYHYFLRYINGLNKTWQNKIGFIDFCGFWSTRSLVYFLLFSSVRLSSCLRRGILTFLDHLMVCTII